MTDVLTALLSRFYGREVLIDTNILLMYFVGTLDPKLIPTFKRTTTYTVEDYGILVRFLRASPPSRISCCNSPSRGYCKPSTSRISGAVAMGTGRRWEHWTRLTG